MKHFLIFSTLFSISFAQQLLNLNSFQGNNYINALKADAPYNLYVSAHSDDENTLRNVFVISGANQISLYDLKNNKFTQNFGQLNPYPISDSAYLTTSLATDQLAKLNGVIYLSSTSQVANNNFYVYDIDTAQNLKFDGLGTISLTILFLNTNMAVAPASSTKISQWSQTADAKVYIYGNLPYGNIPPRNSEIFSNPVTSDFFEQYFPSVEPFSMSLAAFYMRTYNGAPNFRIEPGAVNVAGTFTTSFTTTGFYMKPQGVLDAATLINMMRDPKYYGWTGYNAIGHLPAIGPVSFSVFDGPNQYNQSSVPSGIFNSWSTDHIGSNIVISSNYGKDGAYFLQYFVLQGPLINGTTLPPTSTVTTPKYPETSTKTSGMLFSGIFLIILVIIVELI